MDRTWASATSYKNESLKVKIAKKKQITMSGLKLISGNSYQGLRKSNKKEIKNESKFFFFLHPGQCVIRKIKQSTLEYCKLIVLRWLNHMS